VSGLGPSLGESNPEVNESNDTKIKSENDVGATACLGSDADYD
jgi:hypothetical protein